MKIFIPLLFCLCFQLKSFSQVRVILDTDIDSDVDDVEAVWKRPVVFAGWEIGKDVITGGQYLRDRIPVNSPVYRAYQLYNNFAGRSSWDQVAVFLLLDESKRYFDLVKDGYCYVNDDGSNKWMTDKDSPYQEYLVFKPGADQKELGRILDDLVISVSK